MSQMSLLCSPFHAMNVLHWEWGHALGMGPVLALHRYTTESSMHLQSWLDSLPPLLAPGQPVNCTTQITRKLEPLRKIRTTTGLRIIQCVCVRVWSSVVSTEHHTMDTTVYTSFTTAMLLL